MVPYNPSSGTIFSSSYPTVNIICTGGKIMTDKLYVTWEDVKQNVDVLANDIRKDRQSFNRYQMEFIPFNLIVGISRGGVIPGVMLSHALDIPFIPLEWQTRDGRHKDIRKLEELLAIRNEDQNQSSDILFVDDICDSGETITSIREYAPTGKWAVLHSKKGTMELDYEGERLYNNTQWLVYPWEKK